MAVRHRYTLMCETVIRGEDGKLSLINIFQNIELAQFPGGMSRFSFVVGLDAEPGETVEITIEPPGKKPALLTMPHEVQGERRHQGRFHQGQFQLVGEVLQAVFLTPGVYHIVVRSGGRIVDRYPFGVVKTDRPKETSDGTA